MIPARLVLPALRARDGSFEHLEETIVEALRLGVGGFILFGGRADTVATLTRRLQDAAGYRLLIAADLERGAGQQFAGMTVFPPPGALAHLDDLEAIRSAARVTALEARSLGINWVFAPVADLDLLPTNPIVQTRSFGNEPATVSTRVATWIDACQESGALASVKHFPGHGRTTGDSHAMMPVVTASWHELAADLAPFRAAIAAGVASVMTAHVSYPALDPSGLPATRSAAILSLLRNEMSFDGAVVTDALMMAGATAGSTEAAAALEVIRAGVDLLLYPTNLAVVVAALTHEVTLDPAFATRVDASLRRRNTLLDRVAAGAGDVDLHKHALIAEEIADRLLRAGMLRGSRPVLKSPIDLVLVDDDIDGDWPASPNTFLAEALASKGIVTGPGGSRVVLAFCEARAGKGRGGFGPRSLERLETENHADLVVLFGHRRLIDELPHQTPVLCAWHRQALMQRTAAGCLAEMLA